MGPNSGAGPGSGAGVCSAVLVAALICSMLAIAARAGAQQVTAEEVTATNGQTTTRVAIAQETTTASSERTTNRTTEDAQSTGQQATDPLAGQTAPIEDTNGDNVPNTVGPIAVADCNVAADATVVVEDPDGTRVRLTNGQNATMTESSEAITIEGTSDADGNIRARSLPDHEGDVAGFNEGSGTIVGSTGIACRGSGGTRADSGDEGCENPERVATFTGTENQRTDSFRITGNTFRIRYETEPAGADPTAPTVEVDVLNRNGRLIGEGFLVFDGEDGSENILAGPGVFILEIRADEARYTITVEDCVEDDDDEGDVDDDDDVVNDPKKTLANTGGVSVIALVAGLFLAGGGLLLRATLKR